MTKIRKPAFFIILVAFCASGVSAQETNESSAPWDYRDARFAGDLATVEKHHFNLDVQTLTRGQSSAYPAHDLEFIFRYFPNHHPALNTMARLWRNHKRNSGRPPGVSADMTADRYFEQAISFAPDDGITHMLFGMHLFLDGRKEEAEREYQKALNLLPDSPEVNYNAGLYYFSTRNFEAATLHAKLAYQSGFPLPGLRKKLVGAGAWDGELGIEE